MGAGMAAATAGSMDRADRFAGLLLGTALGDSLGLPYEGLARGRAARLRRGGPLGHRLLPGRRGLVSDDAEHACMTAQALLASGGEAAAFARSLAWRLRGWLAALPGAAGWGTLRAIVKLWLGFPPGRSGVASAGNGPAMRAPVIGAWAADDPARLAALVAASTRMTHADPRAQQGALAVALAAAHATRGGGGGARFVDELRGRLDDPELDEALARLPRHLARGAPAAEVADELGLAAGVTGYIHHTVPAALYVWLRHRGDFRAAVEAAVGLGGDTDTVGAIVGALAGADAGAAGLPPQWLRGLADWPRSTRWIGALGARLATGGRPLPLWWPALPLRNAAFLVVIVAHGVRRLLPPY